MHKLSNKEISDSLNSLNHNLKNKWFIEDNYLCKEFIFNNFDDAFNFMVEASKIIKKINHHPNWYNIYNKVIIKLTTHDIKNISILDFKLAKEIESLLIKT